MRKVVKYSVWTVGVILLLPLLVLFLLYLPPVQDLVKDKALASVSERTGMVLEAETFRLGFPLKLDLEDVYVGKSPVDTLVALQSLHLKVGLRDILKLRAQVDELLVEQVKFALHNDSTGLDLKVDMGQVALAVRQVDLKTKQVDVEFIRLAGGDVSLKTGNRQEEDTVTVRKKREWVFAVDRIEMDSLAYRMSTGTIASLYAGVTDGYLTMGNVGLGTQSVNVDSLYISGAWCNMVMAGRPTPQEEEAVAVDTSVSAPWTVKAHTVGMDNSAFSMEREGQQRAMLDLSGIGVRIDSVFNQKTRVRAQLKDVRAVQRDGVALTAMKGVAVLDSTETSLQGGYIRTANSRLRLQATTEADVRNLMGEHPLTVVLSGQVGLADIAPFYAGIPEEIKDKQVAVNTSFTFTDEKIVVGQLILDMPEHFKLTGSGSVASYKDVRQMKGNFVLRGELPDVGFVSSYLKGGGVEIARDMNLLARLSMEEGDCRANVHLSCGGGRLSFNGRYHLEAEAYDGELSVRHFPLYRFLPSDSLGLVTVDVRIAGRGFSWGKARAEVNARIGEFDYRNHTYQDLGLAVDLRHDRLRGIVMSQDKSAPLGLVFRGDSVGNDYVFSLKGQAGAIDLHALHFMDEPFTVGTGIDLTARMGAGQDYGLTLNLDSLEITNAQQRYDLGNLRLEAASDLRRTWMKLVSGDLALNFWADTALPGFVGNLGNAAKVLQRQMDEREIDMAELKDALSPFMLDIHGADKNAVTRFLKLRGFGFRNIAFEMAMRKRSGLRLGLVMNKPYVGTMGLDSLQFGAWQTGRSLMYSFMTTSSSDAWKGLFNITMTGRMHGKRFRAELKQQDADGRTGFELGINTMLQDSSLTVSLFPVNPILGYNHWTVNADNYVEIGTRGKIRADLQMRHESELVRVQSLPDDGEKTDRLHTEVAGVNLSLLSEMLPFMPVLGGVLDVDMLLYSLKQQLGVEGSIALGDFEYEGQRIGTVGVGLGYMSDNGFKQHRANVELQIDSIYRTLAKGQLNFVDDKKYLLADVDIPAFPLHVVNAFLPADLLRLDGKLGGSVRVGGTLDAPEVDGRLAIREGKADVVMLGTVFRLDTTWLTIDDGRLRFDRYRFLAPNNSRMVLNGEIVLTPFDRMNMDLAVDSRNFEVVNVKKNDRSMIYGKAYADVHARLAGPFASLKMTGDVNLLNGSDIVYTLRSSGPTLEDKSVDLVRFVAFRDSTADENEIYFNKVEAGGFAMNMQLEIGDQVSVGVDLSDDGMNHVSILGGGNLLLSLAPESGIGLSGKYILSGGTVDYNVPIVGKKEFNIQSGSYVEWTGNVMTPQLSISASEQVKAEVEDGDQSRQVMFESIIRIQNNLMHPDVTFDLAAPNDMVVQNQLATFSAEERTRQALNLLIYNTYTAPGAAASNPNAKMAGNALYGFVENELNKYTRKAGLTVGFDSRATEENTTRTDVTYEFSRQLFNDRVNVKIGGRISTDGNEGEGSGSLENTLVDDISIEYVLTKRRNLFAKVFRHSSYEVLDGDVVQTGGGFVWRKSFQKFKDLFKNKNREERRAAKALKEAEEARRDE